jgi:hypothetical protein
MGNWEQGRGGLVSCSVFTRSITFVLALKVNSPARDSNTILRLRTANAVAPLVIGIVSALASLVAFRVADCGNTNKLSFW